MVTKKATGRRFLPLVAKKKKSGTRSRGYPCASIYPHDRIILGSLLAVGAASNPDHIRLSWGKPVPAFDGNLSYRQYATAAASVVSRLWSTTESNLHIRAILQSFMSLVSPILPRGRTCILRLVALHSPEGRRC